MTHCYRNFCVSVCLSSIYQKSPLLPYVDLCHKNYIYGKKRHFQIIIIYKNVRKGMRKRQGRKEGKKEGRKEGKKEGRKEGRIERI